MTWRSLAPALLITLLSTSASAQLRIGVERFGGPQGAAARAALIANLEEQGVEVVGAQEIQTAARDAGITSRTLEESDVPVVAEALDLTAIVQGLVVRERRQWALSIRVRNGTDGSILGTETWAGRTAAALGVVRRNGYERLAPHFEAASPPAPPPPPPPTEFDALDDERPPDLDDEEEDDGDQERFDALSIAFLVGTIHRSMNAMAGVADCFRTGVDPSTCNPVTAAILQEDRSYRSQGFFGNLELGFAFELFPGAFLRDQVVPWLGTVFEFRHSVGLNSVGCMSATVPCPAGQAVNVDTKEYELYAAARGNFRIGNERRDPHISVEVGYGVFLFSLDPADLQTLSRGNIVPPLRHSYLNFGAGFSYGLVPEYLTLAVHGGYRLGLGIGTDARAIWGVDSSSRGGFVAGGEFRIGAPFIVEGAFFSIGAEFFRFRTRFRGQSACANPAGTCQQGDLWEPFPYVANPGDPNDFSTLRNGAGLPNDVHDNYYRFTLAFGYALR